MSATPYYDDGTCVIYHGDCREILPTLTDVDLIVTSPPYNMGLVSGATMSGGGMFRVSKNSDGGRFRDGYGTHSDAMEPAAYDAWQRDVLRLCWATLKSSGAIFYNHRPRVLNHALSLPLGLDFGLPLRQIIVWDRGTGVSVNPRSFSSVCEWIFLFAKPDYRLASLNVSGLGDVWRISPETKDLGHPAPFPPAIPTRAIFASQQAGLILDPFMGSGTTLRAAKDMDRRAIGIEVEERYCESAAKRLQQGALPIRLGEAS